MKATIDLPEELIRQSEAEAAKIGVAVDAFVETALRRYLAAPVEHIPAKFSPIESKEPGSLTSEMVIEYLAGMEAEDDLRRGGIV